MGTYKKSLSVFRMEIRSIIDKKNVLAGILIGIIPLIRTVLSYHRLAGGHTVSIWESGILGFADKGNSMLMLLGFIVALSDAPFVTPRTFFTAHRAGRIGWYRAMCAYIFCMALFYYLVMILPGIFIFCTTGYPENEWSRTFTAIMKSGVAFCSENGLPYPSEDILTLLPWSVEFHTLASMLLYSFCLGEILFVFNFSSNNRMVGTTMVVAVFFISVMFGSEMVFGRYLKKWSFYANALFAAFYDKEQFDAWFVYPYFLIVIYAVYLLGEKFVCRYNYD